MFIKITGVQRQILISLCVYIGQLIMGFVLGWTGITFPMLQDSNQSPLPYLLSESQLSLIASIAYIGAIPSPYVMGWLSNTRGRKLCLVIGGVFVSLANLLLATANNLAMLYCGRFLTGLSVGVIVVINLVYLGEIASTNIRGMLLTASGIFTTCGYILTFVAGSFLSYAAATYVGLALSIVYTISILMIPESPMFYVIQGKDEIVKTILKDLGREDDIDELLASRKGFEYTTTKKDWIELFKNRFNRKALLLVVVANIFQHCSGTLAIIAFSSTIFNIVNLSIPSNTAMIIIGCFQLLGSFIVTFFIDRNGRKTMLSISCVITSLSMLLLGIYFYYDYMDYSGINDITWLPLVLLIIFYIGFDSGLGIIPNTLIGEMFTINVRSKGSAVAMSISWLTGFAVTAAFGPVIENFGGHVAFWFFACTCACGFLFTVFCIPETRGKSLLEIQEMIGK